jgi:cyclohexyl-isocyanide hydratase
MTSGLDCALHTIALAAGPEVAKGIQLFAEYDPQPPFDCGAPHKASPVLVQSIMEKIRPVLDRRREILASR